MFSYFHDYHFRVKTLELEPGLREWACFYCNVYHSPALPPALPAQVQTPRRQACRLHSVFWLNLETPNCKDIEILTYFFVCGVRFLLWNWFCWAAGDTSLFFPGDQPDCPSSICWQFTSFPSHFTSPLSYTELSSPLVCDLGCLLSYLLVVVLIVQCLSYCRVLSVNVSCRRWFFFFRVFPAFLALVYAS